MYAFCMATKLFFTVDILILSVLNSIFSPKKTVHLLFDDIYDKCQMTV